MSEPYRRIWEGNGQREDAARLVLPPDVQHKPRDACNGTTILSKAVGRSGAHLNHERHLNKIHFNHLFEAFLDFGRSQTQWRWNGSAGGWNRYGLVDGTKLTGECKLFVANLWLLARAPYPYGMGRPLTRSPLIREYRGDHNQGFVAEHNGTFYNLGPNVLAPTDYNGALLYLWENHKVLQYRDRFWDACYGVTYDNLPQMAHYQLTQNELRLKDVPKHVCMQSGDFAYEATTKAKETCYFRTLSSREQTETNRKYEGPLTREQAYARHEFLHE